MENKAVSTYLLALGIVLTGVAMWLVAGAVGAVWSLIVMGLLLLLFLP